MNIPQLPTNHPWYFLSKYGTPNVKWCEQTQFSWVTEPANTWSNLAYLFMGLLIIQMTKQSKNVFLKLMGPMMIALCFCSGIYHASYTFALQVLDFLGMYLVLLPPIYINFQRMGHKFNKPILHYSIMSIALTILTVVLHLNSIPIQGIIVVMIILLLATEFKIRRADAKKEAHYGSYFMAMAFMASAAVFSFLDVSRTVCDPHNHIFQGHATWHILSSIAVYFLSRFYHQLEDQTQQLTRSNMQTA